jgi:hypothetical protein
VRAAGEGTDVEMLRLSVSYTSPAPCPPSLSLIWEVDGQGFYQIRTPRRTRYVRRPRFLGKFSQSRSAAILGEHWVTLGDTAQTDLTNNDSHGRLRGGEDTAKPEVGNTIPHRTNNRVGRCQASVPFSIGLHHRI